MRVSAAVPLPTMGEQRPVGRRWERQLAAEVPAWAARQAGRVAVHATRRGIGPDELDDDVFTTIAVDAGWRPATAVQYRKALRQVGIPLAAHPTPLPRPGRGSWPRLYDLADHAPAARVRTACWLRLAAGWPLQLDAWCQVRTDMLRLDGDDVHASGPDGTVRILGAGVHLRRWLAVRSERGWRAEQLLVAVHPDRFGQPAGSPLSPRGLQAAFARTVRDIVAGLRHDAALHDDEDTARALTAEADGTSSTVGYRQLTYDTYRRLLLEAGAPLPSAHVRGHVHTARRRT